MKTIELNEQQIELIKDALEEIRSTASNTNMAISRTWLKVCSQILNKLNEK